jgi:hypothetical protein
MVSMIHAVQAMWDAQREEEDWVFLLIDSINAFNEQDRTVMVWNVQHGWSSGVCFLFNMYTHWAMLVIRVNYGTGGLLYSQQGVTQGDLMVMLCCVGFTPADSSTQD